MTPYVAPVADMLFVLEELAGLKDAAALPVYEEVRAELVAEILGQAARFAGEVLSPLNQSGDRQGCRLEHGRVVTPDGFRDAYRQFTASGWMGLACPAELGGQGLPELVAAPVQEMWKAANHAFSLCPMLTQAAVRALLAHGTPEQIGLYVPRLVSGEWTGTMNLTEPQAGSDLSAVATHAVPEGDHFRITGTKIFITWGDQDFSANILHMVLARLPDAPPGSRGLSLFLVPKLRVNPDGSPGAPNDLRCVSLEHKLGLRACPTAVMAYGDQGGAWGQLVGEAHGGLRAMFTMMNHGRLAIGLEGVAVADRAYRQALAYARERVQGQTATGVRTTLIRHPDVRRMLMTMKAATEAMRALAYATAALLDRAPGDEMARARLELFTPVFKGWCTESAVEIASLGIQVHGGMGYVEETGAAQYLRDVRVTPIYEGTTGIQANDLLQRKLCRDGGAAMRALVADMGADLERLKAAPDLADLASPLGATVDALDTCARWLLEMHGRDAARALAGAVPFLLLAGTASSGWLMARTALAARRRLAAGASEARFLRAKIATTRFYTHHLLPRAAAYRHAVLHGAEAALELGEEDF